ncbi:putative lipoprotein [Mucinivorans hirudinis]|uniref:Putative lipoprotein n=1 Tax=Mucinivorans hirudinis TaxID=1433126 RepID=A0A060REX2_9BACT|nr:putative lipoprotein [Mucinivorans hirudinis]
MKRLFTLVALSFFLANCTDSTQEGTPVLQILLEDSPADYQDVKIKIENVAIFSGDGWHELNNYKSVISILNYTAGKSLLIVNESVPKGDYSKIRFTFAREGALTYQNRPVTLKMTETNAVIELPISLRFAEQNEYLYFDFDVAASIDIDNEEIKPQISFIDISSAGAISGAITNSKGIGIDQQMLVKCVAKEGSAVKFTYTDKASGVFFIRLMEGEYDLTIYPDSKSQYKYKSIDNVTVNKFAATKLIGIVMEEK